MGDIGKHFEGLPLESAQKVIEVLRIIEVEQKKSFCGAECKPNGAAECKPTGAAPINVLDLDYGETGSYADILYPWPFRYPSGVLADAVAGICRRDWMFYAFVVRLSHAVGNSAPIGPLPTKDTGDELHWGKVVRCIALRNLINDRTKKRTEGADVMAGFNTKLNQIVQYGYYMLTRPRGKLNEISFLMGLDDDKLSAIEELFN